MGDSLLKTIKKDKAERANRPLKHAAVGNLLATASNAPAFGIVSVTSPKAQKNAGFELFVRGVEDKHGRDLSPDLKKKGKQGFYSGQKREQGTKVN